jgi:flagellar protein FliO/FliZ
MIAGSRAADVGSIVAANYGVPARVRAIVRWAKPLAFLLALSGSAFAADDNTIITPGASRGQTPAAAAGASLNSMSLILGVALAGAGGWMVWRNRRAKAVSHDGRALAVDETRSLGNRQYLVVASYEGKKFLIGVCPGRIDMLAPLDGSSTVQKVRE